MYLIAMVITAAWRRLDEEITSHRILDGIYAFGKAFVCRGPGAEG